jgi:hypothetical protein
MKILFLVCTYLGVSAERLGAPKNEADFTEPLDWIESVVVIDKRHGRQLKTASNVGNNGDPSSAYSLGRCEGDCDSDGDCEGSLKCFQRSGLQRVPGCSGTSSKWSGIDFCYDPGDGEDEDKNEEEDHEDSSGGGFRLRLYWEDGYYWQESHSEKKYCMQCDGSSCGDGDKVRIQTCGGDNTKFEFYKRSGGEANIRDTKSSRCMRVEGGKIRMRDCDSGDSKQRFTGSFSSSKFEIHPQDDSDKCVTQQHHPKPGEELIIDKCSTARGDETSYWNKY